MFRSRLYVLAFLAAVCVTGLALGTLPAAAQTPVCDQTYIVAPGDHLSKIAEQFYGDRNRWRIIYDATNAIARTDPSFATIGNPSLVVAGQKLCIPALPEAIAPPVAAATTGRLTLEALKNATYVGIYDRPVTLKDGLYEGEPFAADSPMRPTVTLVDRLVAYGDLNGDGVEDAAVILVESSGGSGVFNYVAPVLNVGGMPVNPAVQALGDRVQIKRMAIEDGQIVTEIVTQGPDDPACCPTLLLRQTFRLEDNRLSQATREDLGTVSYQDLDGTAWLLVETDFGQPVVAGSTITLLFTGERVSGSTGCNTYSASVTPDDGQELTIGPALSTRMACLDPRLTEQETLFLELLSGVRSWGYIAGQLALGYSAGERVGSMLFAPQPLATPAAATPTAEPTAEAATPAGATVTATQVITYVPVAVPAGETRSGSCWTNSLAAGGREDAWRCTSDNAISDPCFEVAGDRSVVVCEPDPTKDDPGFALKLTEPLPEADVPAAAREAYANNGWLLTLADGTVCGFATGATMGANDKRANYLCAGTEWVILGDLQPGVVWQADMALITIGDEGPQLQQSKMVEVRTLWR